VRHDVIARDVVREAADRIGLDASIVDEIFASAPIDFPVRFARHLPLFADRFGMVGITLAARVWLLESTREYSPESLIALIRHEAEHVRQQREHPASFYPRYGLGYLARLIATRASAASGRSSRFRQAYRDIEFEREAYAAGARALAIIERARSIR
jgi:hypothetical protein